MPARWIQRFEHRYLGMSKEVSQKFEVGIIGSPTENKGKRVRCRKMIGRGVMNVCTYANAP